MSVLRQDSMKSMCKSLRNTSSTTSCSCVGKQKSLKITKIYENIIYGLHHNSITADVSSFEDNIIRSVSQ